MDVIFDPQESGKNKRPFSIEIGYWDSVLEIKQKVQKYHGIAVPRQTLVFNGQVLQDDRDVEKCELLQNSRVKLYIAPEAPDHKPQTVVKIEQPNNNKNNNNSLTISSKKIQLKINVPSSKSSVPVEMDVNDTVLRLKEKIQEIEGVPVSKLVVQASGAELQDHRYLRDCELMENAEIDVNIKPSPTGSGTGSAGGGTTTTMGSKRLKLMVLTKCGTKKIPVEMNASDNVGELRKELQKLHQRLHFHLPQEGYFFIYKQNVMDDDRSFRWHHVAQGDTIEIFNGSVTGGS
ncbi:Ubiquitin [Corchorus capsularis]|uniref:Ubiquitin n=1 Tax=Corchorus capsularis TaxID=210143 RepID=A0A1R3I2B1_COCAP|nr:Ubiquitin [Corchorus capsularis]